MAQAEWRETTELIKAALAILEEQQPMTIRQLFYALVVRELLQNLDPYYKRVSRMMTKAREDGRCPWEWIVDRSRTIYAPNVWRDPAQYARAVRNGYRKDYWTLQPEHCEVWVEKDAVIGSISDLCDELGVTVRPYKGFNSATKSHEAGTWLSGITKPITIFYCGDHDASGRCIDTEGPARVRKYGNVNFRFKRLAIHPTDIRKFNLPPQRVKDTDSRARGFREKYGDDTVELDALPPVELRRRIREAVEGLLDKEAWQRAIAVEKVELENIVSTVSEWGANGVTLGGSNGTKTTSGQRKRKEAHNSSTVVSSMREKISCYKDPLCSLDPDYMPYLCAPLDQGTQMIVTAEGVRQIFERARKGDDIRQIASDMGLVPGTIARILARETVWWTEAKKKEKSHVR